MISVFGVSRMADNEKAILVSFDRAPTDDELRDLHEYLRDWCFGELDLSEFNRPLEGIKRS